jgi:hypothetical protein
MEAVPTVDPDSRDARGGQKSLLDQLSGLTGDLVEEQKRVMSEGIEATNEDEDSEDRAAGDTGVQEQRQYSGGPWLLAGRFAEVYSFEYAGEPETPVSRFLRVVGALWQQSQPIVTEETLKFCGDSELYQPLVRDEPHDEPQPLSFYGGQFFAELFQDLWMRILFIGGLWALITYKYYFLVVFIFIPFIVIFTDRTNYRIFLGSGVPKIGESDVMAYIRNIQSSPIVNEGQCAPLLVVESWHNEGASEHSSGTDVLDFHEHVYLNDSIEVKYTGSMEADVKESIKRAVRKVSQEGKVLAIESTFCVEVDPDLETMVIRKLKRMMSNNDKYMQRIYEKNGGMDYGPSCPGKARLWLMPNKSYKKVILVDGQEKADNVYLRSDAALASYYFARVVFGPALVNRLVICNKTITCKVDFKVKVSSTGATQIFAKCMNDSGEAV